MTDPSHLPYEEEAKLFTDIIQFFTDRLPHAIGDTTDHLSEAALSMELFEALSAQTDEDLAKMGISRDELSKVAAAASGLFIVANNRQNT
jgi:hypothetical protein